MLSSEPLPGDELASCLAPPPPPVECVDHFFLGMVTASRPSCIEFSTDGLHCISAHEDNAVRWVDVLAMQYRATIRMPTCGVQRVAFTQTSDRFWVCPSHPLHPHMYLYSATQEAMVGAVHTSIQGSSSEWPPVHDTGAGAASMATCPTSDVLAVVRYGTSGPHLQLLHPLVSAPVASTSSSTATGRGMRHVSWSRDGMRLVVSADAHTLLFDVRKLDGGPLQCVENRCVFPATTTYSGGAGAAATPCVGSFFNSSADTLLMTSFRGEAVCVDLTPRAPTTADGQTPPTVVSSYHHGQAALHFVGATVALPAQYLEPDNPASLVVHPGASVCNGGRHLLVYEGYDRHVVSGSGAVADAATRKGALCYQVQSRENEPPRAVGVHPHLRLVAVGTRGVNWWVVHGGDGVTPPTH